MGFLAQINLANMPRIGGAENLPGSGWLTFFYDGLAEKYGLFAHDADAWRVLFCRCPTSDLRRCSPPAGTELFRSCSVTFSQETTWPESEHVERQDFDAAGEAESLDKLEIELKTYGYKHRIFGYADNVQGDVRIECCFVTSGVILSGDTYDSPRGRLLRSRGPEWELLLQLDSDPAAEMMWGDAGRLYFLIHKDDLAAGLFENIWMVMQCY